MATDEEILESQVRFGDETLAFLKSNVGQYLLDRSKEEVDRALEELKTADPFDNKEIQRLQNIIQRNEGVENWLGEIIQAGRDARDLLAGEEI